MSALSRPACAERLGKRDRLEPQAQPRQQTNASQFGAWGFDAPAQSRAQLGPLCTSEDTPADKQIDACNKIIALKVFSGEKLATVYFWRAVGWNKKGYYAQVIADTTKALRLKPDQALYNMRGSAYYDKGKLAAK